MKDTKQENPSERDVQSGKEGPNQSELDDKYEAELKNINNNTREWKRKIIKENEPIIEKDVNQNCFLNN